ncbi:MAG: EamA family transporter [Bacteroidales bacterium]
MQNIIYLIIHILFALGLFISLKFINIRNINKYQAIAINYAVAFIITTSSFLIEGKDIHYDTKLLIPSVFVGILFVSSFLAMTICTKRVGIGVTTSLNKMSVVIPVTMGILFLGQKEEIEIKIAGIALALISFILILYKKADERKKGGFILPVLVFLLPGLIDSSMEITKTLIISKSGESEMFLSGVFSTALILSIILVINDHKRDKTKEPFRYETLFLGGALGLFNFLSSKMLLINVGLMGGSVVFPVHNASVVMLTALTGLLFFGERFSKRQWFGVVAAVIAVFIIAATLK